MKVDVRHRRPEIFGAILAKKGLQKLHLFPIPLVVANTHTLHSVRFASFESSPK
jgi:hypothetical protein